MTQDRVKMISDIPNKLWLMIVVGFLVKITNAANRTYTYTDGSLNEQQNFRWYPRFEGDFNNVTSITRDWDTNIIKAALEAGFEPFRLHRNRQCKTPFPRGVARRVGPMGLKHSKIVFCHERYSVRLVNFRNDGDAELDVQMSCKDIASIAQDTVAVIHDEINIIIKNSKEEKPNRNLNNPAKSSGFLPYYQGTSSSSKIVTKGRLFNDNYELIAFSHWLHDPGLMITLGREKQGCPDPKKYSGNYTVDTDA